MLIQWTEEYSTGVEEIDNQHKEIFNQLNRLHDAITSGLGKEVIRDTLLFAQNYASDHFSYEESCMEKYKCPVAAQNKKAHQQFIDKMEQVREQLSLDDDDITAVLDVYRELRDWIQSHILKVDSYLRQCGKSHQS